MAVPLRLEVMDALQVFDALPLHAGGAFSIISMPNQNPITARGMYLPEITDKMLGAMSNEFRVSLCYLGSRSKAFLGTKMKAHGSIKLLAEQLQEALAVVVPKRRKNARRTRTWPITLKLDAEHSVLEISEAKHALKCYRVDATGTWPAQVQVDGQLLRQITEKYAPDAQIELVATDDEICLLKSNSIVRMKRIDAGGKHGIEQRPVPPDPRHAGPVEVPPDPIRKRVELGDTWTFSARVPVPQHRDPKDK